MWSLVASETHFLYHCIFSEYAGHVSAYQSISDVCNLPVYNGTHVNGDIGKASQLALLHRVQIHQLIIHMNKLHASLKWMLK